jgi:hypothetical protein
MHQFLKFIYFGITLYTFRMAVPSIIRSLRLYIYLLLYVQSWTSDDGRKDRPKHVDCYSEINKFEKLVYLVGITVEMVDSIVTSLAVKYIYDSVRSININF